MTLQSLSVHFIHDIESFSTCMQTSLYVSMASSLGAALGYLLERVDAGVEDGEVLELLHRVGDLQEDVLADVELDQLRQRGERRRDGVHVVVRQVQRPELLR